MDETGGSPDDAELRSISESIEQLSDLWQLYKALKTTTPDVTTVKDFLQKWTQIVGENVAKLEMIKLLTTLDISVESDGRNRHQCYFNLSFCCVKHMSRLDLKFIFPPKILFDV